MLLGVQEEAQLGGGRRKRVGGRRKRDGEEEEKESISHTPGLELSK